MYHSIHLTQPVDWTQYVNPVLPLTIPLLAMLPKHTTSPYIHPFLTEWTSHHRRRHKFHMSLPCSLTDSHTYHQCYPMDPACSLMASRHMLRSDEGPLGWATFEMA